MKVYNSQSREKEQLIPVEEGKVKIYSCGPTVYNYIHIGNARPFIVFDTLRRYLMFKGLDVEFVQNFTDIDDKMINKAQEEGITVEQLADRFIGEYFTDADSLNILRASVHPKATENIEEIIQLIETLIEKGLAYEVNGDVYYDLHAFPEYGKLSGQDLEDLEAGARIEIGEEKRDPMDFALWKSQKPGEPAWKSPWGMGRPGWHIECSAMSMKYLGESIDIHTGGKDLLFPHHENEVAQSEGATGKEFVKYWMHNGYINIDNQKMSKSLGNFFTVRDITSEFNPMVLRLFMLSSHYRSPINFSKELLQQSAAAYERLTNCYEMMDNLRGNDILPSDELKETIEKHKAGFMSAMEDDLNTADAIGSIFELVRDLNIYFKDTADGSEFAKEQLVTLCGILGIKLVLENDVPQEVIVLAQQRENARKNKDWAESDRIRDEIAKLGFVVKDTKEGFQLRKE